MMKLQSIILVLICGIIHKSSCEKLDDLENEYRLKTCGGIFLREFRIHFGEDRHVFTSSQVVLAKGGYWALNEDYFDTNKCDPNGHFNVPKHFLDGVEVVWKGEPFGVANFLGLCSYCVPRNVARTFQASPSGSYSHPMLGR
ncbi:hypothetical protein L5515_010146 [Caenorhabditis briggsae]|uniref:Uncharacterized protein n=1 Tax=Caenorhabditis briggsae TaxID=6238 RepID=A0AAE9JCT6_CAEBR|nr:hypothetical protein L5515_010146 [Caenorhabditis briggsae]